MRQPAARLGHFGIVFGSALEALNRILELIGSDQQIAEIEIGLCARRIQQQRVLQRGEGSGLIAELPQRRAQVVPAVGVAGIDLDRLGEAKGRVLELAVLRINTPEVGPTARIVRREFAGAAGMAHRQPRLAAGGVNLRQVPMRVGILRHRVQALAATVGRATKVSDIESGL